MQSYFVVVVLEYSVLSCLHEVQHLGQIYIAAVVNHQWVGLKTPPDVALHLLLFALTLQIQSGKCCALGEFLIKLWSAMQVQYACTARVVLVLQFAGTLNTVKQIPPSYN